MAKEEERRISPAILIVPVVGALGLAVVAGLAFARAAPPKEYVCPYCGAKFSTEAEVLAHIETEHPEEPPIVYYTCTICGAQFSTEEELDTHILSEHPEEEPTAQITAVSWTIVDFPFPWYGEWPTVIAKFAKAQVEIQSNTEFVAKIGISCPDVIAPINLFNEDQRQKILDWYDELIAAATTEQGRQIYQTQKNAFLTFPEVDGFTISIGGYPATQPEYWIHFTQYLIQSTSTLYFNGSVLIVPQGTSTINVGFFKRHNAVLGLNPVLIELYRDETLLSSLESEILPP